MITESLTCISAAAARASASTACVAATEISSVSAREPSRERARLALKRRAFRGVEPRMAMCTASRVTQLRCQVCRRESGAHPHAEPILRASEELQPEEQALLLCARHVQRGRRRLCLGCFGKHWHMCCADKAKRRPLIRSCPPTTYPPLKRREGSLTRSTHALVGKVRYFPLQLHHLLHVPLVPARAGIGRILSHTYRHALAVGHD